MKCKNCGAEISAGAKKCEFCGSRLSYEMQKEQEQLNKQGCPKCGSSNIMFNREKQAELKGKKGTSIVRNTVGICNDCGFTWNAGEKASNKKSKTWLWVLGWIFIFPVPVTILMLRKKDMKPVLKYGIICLAWFTFLLFALVGGSNNDADGANRAVNRSNPQKAETTTSDPAATPTQAPPPTASVAPTSKPTPSPTPLPTPTSEPEPTPTPLPTPGQKRSFKVDISRQRTDNNETQIGSKWTYYYELNEKELKNGSACSISAWDTITLYAKHAENDGNPDIGEKTITYIVTESDIANGFTVEMKFSVTENGGRYRGLSADFTVKFKFTPQG